MDFLDCFTLDFATLTESAIGFSYVYIPEKTNVWFLIWSKARPLIPIFSAHALESSPGVYTMSPSATVLSRLYSAGPGYYTFLALDYPTSTRVRFKVEIPTTAPSTMPSETPSIFERRLQSTLPRSSSPLLSAILQSNFQGASGYVDFRKDVPKGRNYEGIAVGIFNIRPNAVNPETGKRSFGAALISTWKNENGWADLPDAKLLYRDGSSEFSGSYRRIYDAHYITPAVRSIGLCLMGMAWLFASVSIILIQWLRQDPAVHHAQPFFLQVLCFGSIILSATIFTISFDEGAGWTNRQLSVACSLTPWFFSTGHIVIFCALFSKLWNMDRILKSQQNSVSDVWALWPLALFLMATLSILLAHSIYDPWSWERHIINEMPAETYGKCQSQNAWAFFSPLTALLFLAEAMTLFLAWKTAVIPSIFQDSTSVMFSCLVQIQAWSIGVPMLIFIGYSSVDATYFGRVFLIWIFAVSGVALAALPKLITAIQLRRNPQHRKKGRRVVVTGLLTRTSRVEAYPCSALLSS